jgi:uncharacterized membrane protein
MSRLHRTIAALFAAAVVLIGTSGIPALKNAHHGWKWILGGIGWFGGWIAGLLVIVLALYAIVRAALNRRRAGIAA